MKYFVAVTDSDWYSFLSERKPQEINFWRPSGLNRFQAVTPGSPFLFKLHSPYDYITGGGFFIHYDVVPLSIAWEAFGEHNGAPDFPTFQHNVKKYRKNSAADLMIGCIILGNPFFFDREHWIPIPSDWRPNIVRGKTYDTSTSIGAALWSQVSDLLLARDSMLGEDLLKGVAMVEEPRFGALYFARSRLGQGAFRMLVTGVYEKHCAITGEKVLPVLEAAHIKPYSESGPNEINNGILLRSDLHRLFDSGYITVTPDLSVKVSRAIRDHYHNGEHYLTYNDSRLIKIPRRRIDRPAREYLEYHNREKFIV